MLGIPLVAESFEILCIPRTTIPSPDRLFAAKYYPRHSLTDEHDCRAVSPSELKRLSDDDIIASNGA
jgi:hypothetical protein